MNTNTSDRIALAAAIISLLSLLASGVFAFFGWRYTKEQIRQAKTEFRVLTIPHVTLSGHCELAPPPRRLYLQATNNHSTVALTILNAFAVLELPSGKVQLPLSNENDEDELVPHARVGVHHALDEILAEHFSAYSQSAGAAIHIKPTGAPNTDAFPLKFHFSFLPQIDDPTPVERVRELFFEVTREAKG
jgi:hypothetical protein